MKKTKYVAYLATYTQGHDKGMTIYDVDIEKGRLEEKSRVVITNPSYFTISHNKKFVYSITDMGVEAFKILPDGGLEMINKASINGMRGCHISTDYRDKYLFVAGYHDGKITVLELEENGGAGKITCEVFHKGMGSIAERSFRPHIRCVKMTRDNKYLCATDLGMDQTKVYSFDHVTGKLKLYDIIRSDLGSAPKYIKFSGCGRFAYINHELKNIVDVYEYSNVNNNGEFKRIQTISTLNDYHATDSASCAMKLSRDGKYLFVSSAGDNSVAVFSVDTETGLLTKKFILPISGNYPKDILIFPDAKHIASLNHESDTITFFTVDMEKKIIVMNGRELKIPKGNCGAMVEVEA